MLKSNIEFLTTLEQVIEQRKAAPADSSYTAALFRAGTSRIAQKLGEEAVELALASVATDRQRIVAEAADLMYHLLVLLRQHDLTLSDVANELEQRRR